MSRKICVVTGTRAEYGLLRRVLRGIQDSPSLQLQLIVTGAHLAENYGLTYKEIEHDGFRIDQKIDMQLGANTSLDVIRSMGLGLTGLGAALQRLQPDLLVLLGDRFEVFAAAAAATILGIPIAHLHGGETTEGAFDEAMRHSITKMAHLHFVAAERYRERVIQLGEDPARVFLVGGLGADNIKALKLLNREELESALGFELGAKSLLITFHPVTLESAGSERQMKELLAALGDLDDTQLIFTMPNADPGSRLLADLVREFVAAHPNSRSYVSLGQLKYLSCLQHVDGVVGNSSSGLLEAPSFGKATVNIGDRQRGRLKAESVLDCAPDRKSIRDAIDESYSTKFRSQLSSVRNPYGNGGTAEKVVGILAEHPLKALLKKRFYDLEWRKAVSSI